MGLRATIALTALAACAVLAGCNHTAMLASLDGYGLYYQDEGDRAKLAYGLPNSDEVGLMLECVKRSGLVEVSDVARRGLPQRWSLTSDRAAVDLPVRLQAGDSGDQPVVVADTPASTAALQGFRRSGRIEVHLGDTRYGVQATAVEREGVERFFAACGRGTT